MSCVCVWALLIDRDHACHIIDNSDAEKECNNNNNNKANKWQHRYASTNQVEASSFNFGQMKMKMMVKMLKMVMATSGCNTYRPNTFQFLQYILMCTNHIFSRIMSQDVDGMCQLMDQLDTVWGQIETLDRFEWSIDQIW